MKKGGKLQGTPQAGLITVLNHGDQGFMQALLLPIFARNGSRVDGKKSDQGALNQFRPMGRRAWSSNFPGQGEQFCGEFKQNAGTQTVLALDIVMGQDIGHQLLPFSVHGVTNNKPIQAKTPGVLRVRGLTVRPAVFLINAPTNPAAVYPLSDPADLLAIQVKTPTHRLPSQKIQDLRGRQTTPNQFKEGQQGIK